MNLILPTQNGIFIRLYTVSFTIKQMETVEQMNIALVKPALKIWNFYNIHLKIVLGREYGKPFIYTLNA